MRFTINGRQICLAMIVVAAVRLFSAFVSAAAAIPVCALSDSDSQWIQRALDGWHEVSREFLRLEPAPLPWVVLFDASCVWHLAPDVSLRSDLTSIATALSFSGNAVPVLATPHSGSVQLPNGRTVPAQAMANASVYRNGTAAFFVISLPEVWRRDPRHAERPHLDKFFQGLVIHEMTHTRQLIAINRELAELRGKYQLPAGLDDDIVQRRFEQLPRFRAAVEAEREVFFQAIAERGVADRRALVARGLLMARERRARFFTGSNAVYAKLEDVFLTMEGAGQWAAYRWAKSQAGPGEGDAAIIEFVRDNRKYWSQEEGLALFLLIDTMVPGWQARVFGPALISPFALLDEAVSLK